MKIQSSYELSVVVHTCNPSMIAFSSKAAKDKQKKKTINQSSK